MQRQGKSKIKQDNNTLKDWHASLGALLLKSEKAPDSLERLLAICRYVLVFLTTILKPASRFQDTPCVILGHHYLSHRELAEIYRGDPTRVYLQEICSYDTQEAPIHSSKYSSTGHTNVVKCNLDIHPVARARLRKEGTLLGSGSIHPYIEIGMHGQGTITLYRHDEEYTFTLPSLILLSPANEECRLDYDGNVQIECPSTGLVATIEFKPWKDGNVLGSVARLSAEGQQQQQQLVEMSGQWTSQINASSSIESAQGMLFDASEYTPLFVQIPPQINMQEPGPMLASRLWSALLESVLYADSSEAVGKKVVLEMTAMLPRALKDSLMYSVPPGPSSK